MFKYNFHWKQLITLSFGFWTLSYLTDLLGEPSWKKYSNHVDDILKTQMACEKDNSNQAKAAIEPSKFSFSLLIWNVSAFMCSLVFFTCLRSISWFLWQIYRFYSSRMSSWKINTSRMDFSSIFHRVLALFNNNKRKPRIEDETKSPTRVLFKNQVFTDWANHQGNSSILMVQEHAALCQEVEALKKENAEMHQKLASLHKNNATAKNEVETYRLQVVLLQEELVQMINSMKTKGGHKSFTAASQEMVMKKLHNLEIRLQETEKENVVLRNKLSSAQKNCNKFEETLRSYKSMDVAQQNQIPEKDIIETRAANNDVIENDPEMCQFQKKVIEIQNCVKSYDLNAAQEFNSSSKISVDMTEPMKDMDAISEPQRGKFGQFKKPEPIDLTQNLFNYTPFKSKPMRPKLELNNIEENSRFFNDTTGSSSDEMPYNNQPRRIISSTVEFQNFMKNLNSGGSAIFNQVKSHKRSNMNQ